MCEVEKMVGIERYISSSPGIGGRIKDEAEHFYVEEVAKLPELHDDGKYVIVKVKKTNWDTMNFARILAKVLGISQKRVEYAGTKDKKAVSVQYFSISNLDESKIQKLKDVKIKDAEIEVIGKARKPIKLGDLVGNKFRIRVLDADNGDKVESIRTELEEKGIPNYFGLQRFGSIRFITHEVGKHLLKRDYEMALWIYVAKPYKGENEEVRKIREDLWESRDVKAGLKELPKYLRYERILLQKLREGKSEEEAILSLPKNLKMMFIHAYQSYVFNRLLSARIEEFGDLKRVDIGDAVDFIHLEKLDTPYPCLKEDYTKITRTNYERVKFLISEDRAFLALPLPGYETELGDDWVSQKVKDILDEDGIDLKDFRHEHPEFSSKGSFRVADMPVSYFEYSCSDDESVFSFFLPKGCYATSLLREFTKTCLS
jgi:tRNA pseudouridine13 synthase